MVTTKFEPHKSSLGMEANVLTLVMYIAMAVISWIPFIGWIAWGVPLVIFFMEKSSKFIKYQAVQALIIGIGRAIIAILFSIIVWMLTPRLNTWQDLANWNSNAGVILFVGAIATIVGLAIMALILYILITAYGYKQVELPFIAPLAKKASAKLEDMNINIPTPQNTNDSSENKEPPGDNE